MLAKKHLVRFTGPGRLRSVLIFLFLAVFILAVFPGLPAGQVRARPDSYIPHGACDAFPRADLLTPDGLCVGVLATGLGFPRGVAVKDDTIYIADMGGWQPGQGRLLALGQNGHAAPRVLLSGLDRPDGLVFGADGQLYMGLPGHVVRVGLHPDGTAEMQQVLTGLPVTGRNILTVMAPDPRGDLYVSAGSSTNNCESETGKAPDTTRRCPELDEPVPRAAILRFRPGTTTQAAGRGDVMATGLRNPVAMTVMPGGTLLAAVNARDNIDSADPDLSGNDLPHDTYHVIQRGRDYGWPYCYDKGRAAPEYPAHICAATTWPDLLLPAHSAPLGMIFYNGTTLPGLRDHVLIAYHGYRDQGHRVVSLAIRPNGKPAGDPQPLVWGWQDLPDGAGPAGSPAGLAVMADGSVLITEDHNGALLRLAAERPSGR
ncbi:PQQ-dependent sugar dehydrogenase [Acetobacter oeni]|uniref:Uncharacterized protein n=1 Tax=Acetobacter oeni TaxID=304077 RepID=A0A511XIW2_9PROT|nr:PQQ-dependent sugar dehydrogenase [Acetobacter oeni]MBB3882629.1 glucose/arabinose dehydrogenase [Acetobacter oeni]NHO18733.1 glucose dehydrogenase [Acetobacter oeni]GBR06644.1 glucose/sorbosone dehydrogenase [Acetobacter oeni LMG 21952]GEN62885.1 hypothetical protein AOE01nite_11090 [Acetobacter oeni]